MQATLIMRRSSSKSRKALYSWCQVFLALGLLLGTEGGSSGESSCLVLSYFSDSAALGFDPANRGERANTRGRMEEEKAKIRLSRPADPQ